VSLRTRLWLVLGAIFLVPLVVGVLVLAVVVPTVRADQVKDDLREAGSAAVAGIAQECRLLGLAARTVGLEAAARTPTEAARAAVEEGYADYAALLDGSGGVVEEFGMLPDGAPAPGELRSCSREGTTDATLAEQVDVTGVPRATTAVTAIALDADLLGSLSGVADADVLLLDGEEVVATTADEATAAAVAAGVSSRQGLSEIGDRLAVVEQVGRGSPMRVAVTAPEPGMQDNATVLLVVILLAGAIVAVVLVTVVARGLSQPFADLTEAAERVARGDLDTRITTPGEGEAGRLGDAFNRMTSELRRNMSALEQSRGDLRDSLERIGDTLMSTHDLEGLLQVVLDTAVVTLQASAGVVLYGAPDQLHVVAQHGLREQGRAVPAAIAVGQGVLGRVVGTGEGVHGRLSSGPPELTPVPTEPSEGDILAVPLRSMGTVLGVLALYDRTDGQPFDATDDDALRTLAGQASIAIDNVQLHQEAQRLSTTDALTGLWNFRYLSMSLAREIERSTRFDRPLAVLMLDLDHFKQVNDIHGHAVGDAVLRELAQRVQEQIREVDTFARYGGEEFVVVLPETTVDGATQLAERICTAVRRTPFHVEGDKQINVTISVGGAAFPAHGSSAATLMRAADKALYVAKHEGRDRWHVPSAQLA
jgi:two-component system, cell cycle response regulator